MRRSTLDLVRCVRCSAGSLVPRDPVVGRALVFGPAQCLGCGATFPVHEGLLDLGPEVRGSSPLQRLMEQPWLARSWERTLRPALDALASRGRLDREREFGTLRALLGTPPGPLLDLGCGPGTLLRRLSRELATVPVIGLDLARPMLDEAMAQAREHGEAADFVRALVPPLPFADHVLGAVVAAGLVHLVADLDLLLREVARTLRPGGRLVASGWEGGSALRPVTSGAGLYPRAAGELEAAAIRAGLIHFQLERVGAFVTWKAELP